MRDRPSRPVWRMKTGKETWIFLFAVNDDCTLAIIDWPENNDRLTFIPDNFGWVMPLYREKINPDDSVTHAEDAGQASKSVYAAMGRWAREIFQFKIDPGYHAYTEEEEQQLMLFQL